MVVSERQGFSVEDVEGDEEASNVLGRRGRGRQVDPT